MKSLGQIFTIARFEMKTLLRSWFFRIFAFVGLFIITIFNIAMLMADGPRWNMRAVASVIPYTNMMMLNIAQSIIIAFLATEFMKRDKKLDTTEVIYIRSMSNGVYILGKTTGTLIIFLMLNLLVLIITGTINVLMEGVVFSWVGYMVYPLLMSIPTLIFIMGLSYVVMLLLRNQAVTFVVLLGYIAACLFYLNDKLNYALDYMAFSFPMLRSEFVGFADFDQILLQRGSYLLLGLGFIFLTILMIGRLRQSRAMTSTSIALALIFIAGGAAMMLSYVVKDNTDLNSRDQMRAIESQFVDQPNVRATDYDIDLRHEGKQIISDVTMKVDNPGSALDSYFILLNPGLEISSLKVNGEESNFKRNFQVVEIPEAISEGGTAEIKISYSGTIDENAMYLDIDEEARNITYRVAIYSVGTRYHFIEPEYVLLTQEAKWYPQTRIPFDEEKGIMNDQVFSNYKMKVQSSSNLFPVSQGERINMEDGVYLFEPEYPLPQISLAMGDYVERSIRVDSIDYKLAIKSDHYYFDEYFANLGDTLVQTIRTIKNDYELDLDLNYPYKRFSVVEVPAMFVSFPRIYTQAKEVMQPEMSFLPEKGMALVNTDFQFRRERLVSRNKERGGELSDQEIEAQLLRVFVTRTLTTGNGENWFSNGDGASFTSSFSIFPSYYSYSNFITSEDWPFFNKSFESFLWERVSPGNQNRWFSATTLEEDANIALRDKSFEEILQDEDDELITAVLSVKGNYLFNMLKEEIGDQNFNSRLSEFLNKNRFKSTTEKELEKSLLNEQTGQLAEMIKKTSVSNELPGFLVSDAEVYSFKDGDRSRFAVQTRVENTGEVDGLIQLTFRMGGRGGGGRGGGDFQFGGFGDGGGRGNDNNIERLLKVEKGTIVDLTIILDEEPRGFGVNTIMSVNLPLSVNFQIEESIESEGSYEEKITVVEPTETLISNEYIVDNEDDAFSVTAGQETTPLRALILGDQILEEIKYSPMGWRAPGKWTPTISQWAYGDEVRSAYFIGTGDGVERATWNQEIEEGAFYDIYVYLHKRMRWGRRDEEPVDDYHYIIHSDDGETEITVELKNIENGWNNLGSYYISPGTTKVELINKSKGRTVVADAIKWVKR